MFGPDQKDSAVAVPLKPLGTSMSEALVETEATLRRIWDYNVYPFIEDQLYGREHELADVALQDAEVPQHVRDHRQRRRLHRHGETGDHVANIQRARRRTPRWADIHTLATDTRGWDVEEAVVSVHDAGRL